MESAILPLDIIILILEELREEVAALKSCSTVCREWSAISRLILFRTLYLTARRTSARSFGLALQTTADKALEAHLHEFMEFLDGAPGIRSLIRTFVLRTDNAYHPCAVHLEAVVALLVKLPVLHTVTITGVYPIAITPDPQPVCTSVRTLELRDMTWALADPNYISKFLAHLPNVADVRVFSCAVPFAYRNAPLPHPAAPNTRLESLSIVRSRPLAQWLYLHENTLRSLRSIHISSVGFRHTLEDFRALERVLECAGESLQHLHLGFGDILEDATLSGRCMPA